MPLFTGLKFGFGASAGGGGAAASTTGGYIVTDGGYTYHIFHSLTSQPDVLVMADNKTIDFLMVAGGGGGGGRYGTDRGSSGGGGGGGVVLGTSKTITVGSYPVGVGTGGLGPAVLSTQGVNGTDSTFWEFTSKGGGGGGHGDFVGTGGNGSPGGSGGGANEDYGTSPQTGGNTTQPGISQPSVGGGSLTQHGFAGGNSGSYPGDTGGGGGGAGAAGITGGTAPKGKGGAGAPFTGFPGPVIAQSMPTDINPIRGVTYRDDFISAVGPTGLYAGGGGGTSYSTPGTVGSGGVGGGGGDGDSGVQFTGGGASGVQVNPKGANYGGNGIVVIKYTT